MNGSKSVLLAVIGVLALSFLETLSFGQYWFQSGAYGGTAAAYNNGASAYIQTVDNQSILYGSYGFWIGETLSNGAFIQIGYEVPNATGDYNEYCTPSGCNGTVYLIAGEPTWFWEYFPVSYTGNNFYGAIGPNGSIGTNGTFNRYSFIADGNVWKFYLNNQSVGSINVGSVNSGRNTTAAYAELAGAENNTAFMNPVMFKNISYYKNGVMTLLNSAFAYIGYGKGSKTGLPNPYGVKEISNYANFFVVGSGIPEVQNGTSLWNSLYSLSVNSAYGNTIGTGYYSTFTPAAFSAPEFIYVEPGVREVFSGWAGSGPGSYTGQQNSHSVDMYGNITETAIWKTQYYLNVTSLYGNATGGGWYSPNSTVYVSLNDKIVNISKGVREYFTGWSNGMESLALNITLDKPTNISANWQRQYYLSLKSPYGTAYGSGWYAAGSSTNINLSQIYFNQTNDSRLAFYSWSGVYNTSNAIVVIDSPLNLTANFMRQYLVGFNPTNSAGMPVNGVGFFVDNSSIGDSTMLFGNVTYLLSAASYKGVNFLLNKSIRVTGPASFSVSLPIYDINLTAKSLLNRPLNATVLVSFQNGTVTRLYLGRNGSIMIPDVPFGYAAGYAQYGPITESFTARDGKNVSMLFITPAIIAPLLAVIIGMIIGVVLHRRSIKLRGVGAAPK